MQRDAERWRFRDFNSVFDRLFKNVDLAAEVPFDNLIDLAAAARVPLKLGDDDTFDAQARV